MIEGTSSGRRADGGIAWRDAALAFLIAVAINLLANWRAIPQVLEGSLYNPDSYMRLVRIEAGLRAGHIGSVVARDASGAGVVLHWSHLLDSLLLLAALPLEPLLGWHRALFWVGAASAPIEVGLLAVALTWAVAPLAERRFLWFAALAVGLGPAILTYGRPGVVHHHILLVLAAVMVAGFAFRAAAGEREAGLAAAVWFAFGLWLSPESWPFGLLALGALGAAWLDGTRGAASELGSAGLLLAILLGAILLVDPPPGAAVAFDHVSVVHLCLAFLLAVLGAGMAALDRLPLARLSRMAAGFAFAAVLLGLWAAIFPRALMGPAGLSTNPGLRVLFSGIGELQPPGRPSLAVAYLLAGVFGLVIAGWTATRSRSLLAAYGAFCALVVLALAFRYVRFAPYPEALGAAMLPVALSAISGNQEALPLLQMLGRVGVLALVLLVPRAAPALDPGLAVWRARLRAAPSCDLREVAERLAPYTGEIVLNDPDFTPELLYRTGVKTVGSLFHRGVAAFLRLRTAWLTSPGRVVPAAVRATRAQLILFCPRPGRSALLGAAPPDTLAERLAADRPPAWLHRLWQDRASGYTLYRIDK